MDVIIRANRGDAVNYIIYGNILPITVQTIYNKIEN